MPAGCPEEEATPPLLQLLRFRIQDAEALGISERMIARETGLGRATINDFVHERVTTPRPETLERLTAFLDEL